MADRESLLQELHQHYRDTCEIVGKTDRLRDRYTLYTLVIIAILLLGVTGNIRVENLVSLLLAKWMGPDVLVTTGYLRCAVWFGLFAITLKYFSTAVHRERLLKYVHTLEDQINEHGGKTLITREGKAYSSDYPMFQSWACFVYTWVFPVSLQLIVSACLLMEIFISQVMGLIVMIDCVIGGSVLLSSILYMIFLHPIKSKNEQGAKS